MEVQEMHLQSRLPLVLLINSLTPFSAANEGQHVRHVSRSDTDPTA